MVHPDQPCLVSLEMELELLVGGQQAKRENCLLCSEIWVTIYKDQLDFDLFEGLQEVAEDEIIAQVKKAVIGARVFARRGKLIQGAQL